MLRFYLRLAVMSFVLFIVVLLLIRAQPYDEHELRERLLPKGCPASCFMGIRPGITNEDAALRLLKATGWLASYDYLSQNNSIGFTWTQDTPSWLVNGHPYNGVFYLMNNGLVNQLAVETNLRIGDFQLSLGKPAFQQSSLIHSGSGNQLFYTATYPDEQVSLNVTVDCVTQGRKIRYQDKVFLSYDIITLLPTTNHIWMDVTRLSCP